ncbi:acyl-CoA N-acyltransferase [Cladochytrium replicatum]|nr:acyl-CoA N-acyltransferase [Cladochytrium replicatum]
MSADPPYKPISLKGRRLRLVYPSPPEDDPAVVDLYQDPITLAHLPFLPPSTSLEKVKAWRESRLANPSFKDFRIHTITDPPEFVGVIGFRDIDISVNFHGEVGVIVSPKFHRSGYATEALALLMEHGFASKDDGGMNFHRVVYVTAADNAAMRGWLDRTLGARHEGTYRANWKILPADGDDGKVRWVDSVIYGMLEDEWNSEGRKRLQDKIERN